MLALRLEYRPPAAAEWRDSLVPKKAELRVPVGPPGGSAERSSPAAAQKCRSSSEQVADFATALAHWHCSERDAARPMAVKQLRLVQPPASSAAGGTAPAAG